MMTLKKSREFDRVYRYGRKCWNHAFVVYLLPARNTEGNETPATRYGITASRKAGNSVQRNRAKRLIRESLRAMEPRILPGFDLVIVVRPAAHTLKCAEAQSLLGSLLERARAFSSPSYPSRRQVATSSEERTAST